MTFAQRTTEGRLSLVTLNRPERLNASSARLAGAPALEREAAMACFADPDTAQRIANFAAGRP